MDTIADYHDQREAFLSLLNPDCEKRILLFRGPAGTGKTSLIMACLDKVCGPVYHVPFQLRGTAVSIAEIFWRTGSNLGWDCLPNFTEQLSYFSGINVNIDGNKMRGINNQIRVVLHADNPADREYRQVSLTEAWFEDINSLDQLLLMVMDTYEQATDDVKDWISGPFLIRTVNSGKIRVALAGQEVPDPKTIEWGRCCEMHELFGVREAKHWVPVVENLDRVIPVEHPLDWLAGICHALDGQPDKIMKIIKKLPFRQ